MRKSNHTGVIVSRKITLAADVEVFSCLFRCFQMLFIVTKSQNPELGVRQGRQDLPGTG